MTTNDVDDENLVNIPQLLENDILPKTPKVEEEIISEENKIPKSSKTTTHQTSPNTKKQRKRKIPEKNKTVATRSRKQLKLLQTSQPDSEIKTEIEDETKEIKLKTKDKLKKINPLSSKITKKILPKKRRKEEIPAILVSQPIIKESIKIEVTPKKRGRKPKNKDIITKSIGVEIKRSPRLSKTTESPTIKPIEKQRLTRQIKPTAKILANDDLRQGFELNNILRLNSNSEKDERCEETQQPSTPPSETKKSKNKNLESLINFRTPPKQCPSPEEFLSDIKNFNLGVNQSPEVNKSLNKDQKRDLLKEKEKHLENLGLVRKILVISSESELETEQKTTETEQMPSTSSQPIEIIEIEPETICLCIKPSQYYVKKSIEDMQCSAIDQIETEQIGCANLIDDEAINLLRPSTKIGYMVLCKSHKRRLLSHNCCSGCGVFCTQGIFYVCSKDHFFHKNCANKFVLSTPYDLNLDLSSPTLILKCPHCGTDVPENQSKINLEMRSDKPLVFIPNQRNFM